MKTLTIAVAGKGGTGKTTLSALIIRHLLNTGVRPVLAVDADANANLGDALGIRADRSIGRALHGFLENKISIPPGMTKEAWLEVRLNETLIESPGIDLVVMGRKEGTGCYCYPNTLLRKFLDRLAPNYRAVVMDNEAGMEHLSRRTTDRVDLLLIVTDPSVKGARTAGRMRELAAELGLDVSRMGLIVGRDTGADNPAFDKALADTGLDLLARIPHDEALFRLDLEGAPLTELPDSSPAAIAVTTLMKNLLDAIKA